MLTQVLLLMHACILIACRLLNNELEKEGEGLVSNRGLITGYQVWTTAVRGRERPPCICLTWVAALQ